jgi:hypothetical protein
LHGSNNASQTGNAVRRARATTHGAPPKEIDVINLTDTMHDADFVILDGAVFITEYLRVPDESTVADDIVLEARRGDTEISLTRDEIDDAQYVGEGVYRLKCGAHLRFLTSATIH